MIVLDASAALEVLLNGPLARSVSQRIFRPDETLHAPHLIDVEVAQVLRRLSRRREIEVTRAEQVIEDLSDLPLVRYPHTMFLPAVWALRENATAYDAVYLALSDALGATLVTCDRTLADIPGHGARVDVIA